MSRKTTLAAAAVALLALPASAQAHVTLQPSTAAAGGFTVENVRVPNERDDASTTKVDVQLPPGFAFLSYEAVPGWTAKVTKREAAKPIMSHGDEITEEVARVTWTARDASAAIKPGQFADFPVSVQIPGKAGDTLTFKALQTYSDGEVVRWIGDPDAEQPAPTVAVTAAEEEGHDAAAAKEAATTTAQPAAAGTGDDDTTGGLEIVALVLGGLGLAAGLAALALARRRPASA